MNEREINERDYAEMISQLKNIILINNRQMMAWVTTLPVTTDNLSRNHIIKNINCISNSQKEWLIDWQSLTGAFMERMRQTKRTEKIYHWEPHYSQIERLCCWTKEIKGYMEYLAYKIDEMEETDLKQSLNALAELDKNLEAYLSTAVNTQIELSTHESRLKD